VSKRSQPTDPIEGWEDEGGATASDASGISDARRENHEARSERQDRGGRSEETGSAAMHHAGEGLPTEVADWFTRPLARFFKIEVAAAVVLLLATIAALVLSNSGWAATFAAFWETPIGLSFGDFEFSRSLRHWINDGLMTLFFFVVALELKREIVLGELRHVRTAALSFAAALGGMLVPACTFLVLMRGEAGIQRLGHGDRHGHCVRDRLPRTARLAHTRRASACSSCRWPSSMTSGRSWSWRLATEKQ
jgi:hypothetical protein